MFQWVLAIRKGSVSAQPVGQRPPNVQVRVMMVTPRSEIRILVLAASLRAESLNAKLAALAAESVQQNGGAAELASMEQFEVPRKRCFV
jgi:hypothetical protein